MVTISVIVKTERQLDDDNSVIVKTVYEGSDLVVTPSDSNEKPSEIMSTAFEPNLPDLLAARQSQA